MNPQVRSFHHLATSTWTHIIVDPATGRAAIVDPVLDLDLASGRVTTESAQRLLEYITTTDLTVVWILETHAHADHLTAATWLKRKLTHASAAPAIGIGQGILDVQTTFKAMLNLDDRFVADGGQFDALFRDGDTLNIGDLIVTVVATPGHTPDGVTYRIGDAAFIGDTLFAPRGGSARCDFPGADAATLYHSIQRLYGLPDATRVFLAHDYPPQGEEPLAETSIGAEKASNIHVRGDTSEEEYVALREARDATLPVPRLLWPALQVNIRAGRMPAPEADGQAFLKIPVSADAFDE